VELERMEAEENYLIGENGELREQMKLINEKINQIISSELKGEDMQFVSERAKSRAGKHSLPNIASIKQKETTSPIATSRHKFLLKKASLHP
jgi:hypothetical protein